MNDNVPDKGVISLAGWIDKLLVAVLVLSIAIVATKTTAGSTFKVPGTEVQLDTAYAWIVFAAFTVAHLYLTVLFVRECRHLFREEHPNAKPTWEELTRNGPLFFRGLMPRLLPDGGRFARMRWDDPTTWLAHGGAILFFAAMVPFPDLTVVGFVPALVLTPINWLLGSNWVIAASELTAERDKTKLL